jgi:GT2 family glycosyltransferase
MRIGVPVISTDEGALLHHSLPTAVAQEGAEVVVIDNASTDSTQEVARENGVHCVRLAERSSFCKAMNAAIRAAEGEAVLFMQPDCFLTPGFLDALRTRLEDPKVGSVAPKLVRTDGPSADQRLDAIDAAGMVVDRRRKNGLVGHGRPSLAYSDPGEAFGADGAVALYRRATLDDCAVDGEVFDEDLVTWGSDADLAWRARTLGWRCAYEPGAVAYHVRRYSPTTRSEMPEWDQKMQFRNRYLMIAKNDPASSLLRDLPRILAYELLALGYALLREHHLLPGYVDVARLAPKMRAKRAILQAKRRERQAPPVPYGLEPKP